LIIRSPAAHGASAALAASPGYSIRAGKEDELRAAVEAVVSPAVSADVVWDLDD
jgi:hypothetical protein